MINNKLRPLKAKVKSLFTVLFAGIQTISCEISVTYYILQLETA